MYRLRSRVVESVRYREHGVTSTSLHRRRYAYAVKQPSNAYLVAAARRAATAAIDSAVCRCTDPPVASEEDAGGGAAGMTSLDITRTIGRERETAAAVRRAAWARAIA